MDKVLQLIKQEKRRQQYSLMMIPSENYTYPEVREAVGSVLMHKYSEGYPKKRYYQGNANVDEIELLCQKRALEAFGLHEDKWHVNVQGYSGTPANVAVFNALLNPGDKIMAMFLPEGGHLSHGWMYKDKKITFTSKVFNINYYHVDPKTNVFDYEQIARVAKKVKPKLIISGGTAYPQQINYKKMAAIAKSVGAYYLADIAHEAGLVAGGANDSPFPYADVVTMTTHKTLRGPRGAIIICKKDLGDAIDASIFPGLQGGPHNHTIAGIAIALARAKTPTFKKYAFQVVKNAKALANVLLDHGFEIVSGGTEKHLVLVDLRNKKINGWYVGWALEAAGIIANRNTIPNDPASPYYPSGLRLGTPALTARGMGEREMKMIAEWIASVVEKVGERTMPGDPTERLRSLKAYKDEVARDQFYKKINQEVKALCKKFPVDLH